MEKGNYGYIQNKKKKLIMSFIVTVVIAVAIYAIGFMLNDYSGRNIFTVFAMLFVLPLAKIISSLAVVIQHKDLSLELYKKIKKVSNNKRSVLYDLVLTSSDKIMYIQSMAITKDEYIMLIDKQQNEGFIKTYFKKHMSNYNLKKEVIVVRSVEEYINRFRESLVEDSEELKEILSKLFILQI